MFPGVVIPITASRDKSIKLINAANKGDKLIGVVSQIDKNIEDPYLNDIYKTGTVAKILKVLKMPDGNTTVIIQGQKRFDIQEFTQEAPYFKAIATSFQETKPNKGDKEFAALVESVKDVALQIIKESPNIPSEASFAIKNIESDSFLINFVASNMNIDVKDKQNLLSSISIEDRALKCLKFLNVEYEKLALKNDIQSKVKNDLDQQQREYYLQQQMKTIQEELGDNSYQEDIQELINKSKNKDWNDETKVHFEKELSKLKRMNSQVAEYSVQRNYLDLLVDLPWEKFSEDNFDLSKAQKILDRDHFGLEDVKKRIIEYLAVLKLRSDMKSPILCLYGPPGVGKTSLGKSVAKATGREFIRISLGGVRDESEIRGHRRTYIGSMPGKIIQAMKKAKTNNPLILLDEIDKMGQDFRGDPASAMLEVLDPEQNSTFTDHYMEVEYDLSNVMFLTTANTYNMPGPLLDRMEIIPLSGYTEDEKHEIAKQHLLGKQIKNHGLKDSEFSLTDDGLKELIRRYTREAGVRSLEREIGKLCRKVLTTNRNLATI